MSGQMWIEAAKVEAHGEAARRIVAALKAVEGIPVEALEDGILPKLFAHLVAFYEQGTDIDVERETYLLERLGFLGGAAAACCGKRVTP